MYDVGFPISNWINFKFGGVNTAVRLQFRAIPEFVNVNKLLSSVTKTLQAKIENKRFYFCAGKTVFWKNETYDLCLSSFLFWKQILRQLLEFYTEVRLHFVTNVT